MIEALWPTTVPLLVVCSRLLPSLGPLVGSGILSCWNFALCLERETTMGQCLVLYLLISFLFLFASGFVCEPHDETKAYIPPVELPPPLPGNGRCRKRRKRNVTMRQYYLMRRVRRRPVWRPLRDPIRRWLDLSTWRWRRRIPTDGWKQTPYAYSPRSRSRSYRKRASDNNCKRPRKKPKPNPKEPKWDGQCSDEESFERLKVRFLHEPDVTYGLQYGIDLDAFVKQIDPIKQVQDDAAAKYYINCRYSRRSDVRTHVTPSEAGFNSSGSSEQVVTSCYGCLIILRGVDESEVSAG